MKKEITLSEKFYLVEWMGRSLENATNNKQQIYFSIFNDATKFKWVVYDTTKGNTYMIELTFKNKTYLTIYGKKEISPVLAADLIIWGSENGIIVEFPNYGE